jgi:hypothetical protein
MDTVARLSCRQGNARRNALSPGKSRKNRGIALDTGVLVVCILGTEAMRLTIYSSWTLFTRNKQ